MPSFESASCGRGRANHTVMILLVTSSAKAQACAEAIQRATTETAQITTTFRRAATMLRAQEYSAVVIDESLLEREPAESETVLQHIGMVPIHINFAISGIDRVVRELSAARHRRNKEIGISRQFAGQTLRNELKGTMTALRLSCEMALQVATLLPDAEARIRTAYLLAQEMRSRLGITS